MGDELPKFTAAAVQAAPVFLDRGATIDKACRVIEEAAAAGAQLVVFPETWVPAYPFWIGSPHIFSAEWFVRLYKSAVEVPSAATDTLCRAAARAGTYVVIGINERAGHSIFNSLLYIDDAGRVMGVHRKLMPSFSERTVWGWGDGSGLHVFDTPLGQLGGLICWEHEMTLVKYAMYTKHEQVHASVWPAWTMQTDHIAYGTRQYAYEGGCFVLASCGVLDETLPKELQIPTISANGGSAIIAPNGDYLAGPVYDKEAIVYAEIDLEAVIRQKHSRDVSGHYARPDVVQLVLHAQPQPNVLVRDEGLAEPRERLAKILAHIETNDRAGSDPELLAALEELQQALSRPGA